MSLIVVICEQVVRCMAFLINLDYILFKSSLSPITGYEVILIYYDNNVKVSINGKNVE